MKTVDRFWLVVDDNNGIRSTRHLTGHKAVEDAKEKVKKHGGVFFVMESTHAFRQTDPLVEELHLEDQVQEAPADG
jgi:hypothetical protein